MSPHHVLLMTLQRNSNIHFLANAFLLKITENQAAMEILKGNYQRRTGLSLSFKRHERKRSSVSSVISYVAFDVYCSTCLLFKCPFGCLEGLVHPNLSLSLLTALALLRDANFGLENSLRFGSVYTIDSILHNSHFLQGN